MESPPVLSYSIFVSKEFKVKCFKQSSIVSVRSFVNGFTTKLERYSQLTNIIDHLSKVKPVLEDELRAVEKQLTNLSHHEDINEDLKYRLTFYSSQIRLSSFKSQGRRYTPFDIKVAVDIFLRSRNCYSALRRTIILPHPNTIKSLFGRIETPGSINECKEVVKSFFRTRP